jgi:hypothetical protein
MGSSLFSVPPDASRNTTLLEGDTAIPLIEIIEPIWGKI